MRRRIWKNFNRDVLPCVATTMNYEEKRKHYREFFPFLKTHTWLNHAGHGPWSTRSRAMMDSLIKSMVDGPMKPYQEWDDVREKTRGLLAQFLDADIDEIGFNFTTSLSLFMISQLIPWKAGQNIIVPDRAFPSIVYPARVLEQDGVEARIIETVDGLISEDKLIDAIDRNTKMMIVPLVNFLTGLRLDIPRLSQACRDNGVFLSVDAIQGAGAIKIDVKKLGCHALCFGSPKWMFGPMGVGTIYLDKEQFDLCRVPQMGMCSVADAWNFFDYQQPLLNQCLRYEAGCSAHLSHHGMLPNLEMFLDLGRENIETHIMGLTGYLHDQLTSRGITVLTPRDDRRRAGIITFDAKSAGWENADQLLKTLEEQNITVAVRMGMVRVSPHFYNTRDEIDLFLGVLDTADVMKK